jgi:hypothetical protein
VPVCKEPTYADKGKPMVEDGVTRDDQDRLFILYRCQSCGQRTTRPA